MTARSTRNCCLLVLVAAAVACTTPVDVPRFDAGEMEPRVAKLLDERRAVVLEQPRSAEAWGQLGAAFQAHRLVHEALALGAAGRVLQGHAHAAPGDGAPGQGRDAQLEALVEDAVAQGRVVPAGELRLVGRDGEGEVGLQRPELAGRVVRDADVPDLALIPERREDLGDAGGVPEEVRPVDL